jgi:hypothetical protein
MDKVSKAASILGKKSWKARVAKFGLEQLKRKAAEMGRNSPGRPRLPSDQVTKAALYQRARRERLKRQASVKRSRAVRKV